MADQLEGLLTTSDTALLDELRIAVTGIDLHGTITRWNKAATDLYGWTAAEALDRNFFELLGVVAEGADAGTTPGPLMGDGWTGDVAARHKSGVPIQAHVTTAPVHSPDASLTGAVVASYDISRRRRVEQRLQIQYGVADALAGSATLEEATPRLLRSICEGLGWEVAALWRSSAQGDEVSCVDVWHDPKIDATEFVSMALSQVLPAGAGLPGRVLASGEPAWITDLAHDNNFPRASAAETAGLTTGLAFPVVLREAVLGVIEAFTTEQHEPDSELIEVFRAAGRQIGQLIERRLAEEAVRRSEERKSAILESALDCVITIDHEGKIIEFNPAAEETLGFAASDVMGAELAGLIIPERYREAHRHGLRRYRETGQGAIVGKRFEIMALRADGTEFPVELAITRAGDHEPPVFTGYLRDITDRVELERTRAKLLDRERAARAEAEAVGERLRNLQTITEAALSYVSLDSLLEELLARLTSLLGVDSAQILLPAEDGQSLTVRASKGTPRSEQVVVPLGMGVAGKVAATNSPVVVRHREEGGPGTEDIGSVMGVPLLAEGRNTGVLQVGSGKKTGFDESDVLLLQLAADRMAVAIEHARLFERQRRIAVELQRSLLQAEVPEVEGAQVAVRYLPGGAGLAVGGDWYDVVPLGNGRTGMAIGDVAGRGVRAAAVMGQLRNAFRAYALEGGTPGKVLARLNRFAGELELTNFSTVLYLVFDARAGEVTMANSGHPPPLLVDPDGAACLISPPMSIPLGVLTEAEFTDKRFDLAPGSSILLYTDGLVEDPAVAIDRGLERLVRSVTGAPQGPEDLCDRVIAAMFGGANAADDVAVMALKSTTEEGPVRTTPK